MTIKELRESEHLTQTEFGALLGVSKQAVSLWEAGALRPKKTNWIAICHEFDVEYEPKVVDGELIAFFSKKNEIND